jgi:hypothetical protein
VTEPTSSTRERAIERLWDLAATPPEQTKGSLHAQVSACKLMYFTLGYKPALHRLSEIARIDAARTKGQLRAQESAARLLKQSLKSIKIDKNQVIQ